MFNKILKIIFYTTLCFIAALLIFSMVEYYKTCEIIKKQNWKLRTENRTCIEQLQKCQISDLFREAASKIAEREYSENYNCFDFAKDLQQELEKIDIKSSVLINKERNHAWLSVWIEPADGTFITLDNNYQIKEIRDSRLNVICKCQER